METSIPGQKTLLSAEIRIGSITQSELSRNQIETEGSNDTSRADSYFSMETDTPGGSSFWIPIVPDSEKPYVGLEFSSLSAAIEMYSSYAEKSGFDIKLSTQKKTTSGVITLKYIICSKACAPDYEDVDTADEVNSEKKKRNVNVQKTDCKAKIKLRLVQERNVYEIYCFEERHNHELVPVEYRHLLRKKRQLDSVEQGFIHRAAASNIGATRAHNLLVALKGSRDLVHGTVVDFKNFKRELNLFTGENDAQTLVNKMKDRVKHVHGYVFDYKTEKSELSAFFWADETAKCNHKEFGDIISFDATYNTNKYKMVFVPFTGIDNHRKCVTLCAGMLVKEDSVSYKWLLQRFIHNFNKQPNVVVTDQDPAIKKAVAEVFTETKHRLCMWHITNKLPAKICSSILDNTDFKKKFNKLVWSIYIGPLKFEEKWKALIEEFNLTENRWLSDMYEMRELWIPAYFKNVDMCGLRRTTSRSESENAFFSSFTHHSDNLIQFIFSFDSAMEKQRYTQETLDYQTMSTVPKFKTQQKIERDASKLYTRTMFRLVQNEIVESLYRCSHDSIIFESGIEICKVKERRHEKEVEDANLKELELHTSKRLNEFKVLHNKNNGDIVCTCEQYLRLGILCRHIFYVLKNSNIEEIPRQYVKRRWTKNLIPPEMRKKSNLYSDVDLEAEKTANEVLCDVDFCLRNLLEDKEQLKEFANNIKSLKKGIEEKGFKDRPMKKKEKVQSLMRATVSDDRDVDTPSEVRNKGWPSGKRVVGEAEKAKIAAKKKGRRCGGCGKKNAKHNVRTCKKVREQVNMEEDETDDEQVNTEEDETDDEQ